MKRCASIAVLVCFLCVLCACTAEPSLPSRTDFALDTVVTITLYDTGKADAEDALSAGFAEIERLEALLSATRENSDVARINTSNGQPITVALLKVILLTAKLSQTTVTVPPTAVKVQMKQTTAQPSQAEALAQAVT